jgi:putative tryptophan/tyrosine transport system substrate-binding protein
MITEIRANAKRVAVLWNPTSSNAQLELKNVKAVAPSGLDVTLHDARDASELKRALENIRHSAPDVLIVLNDPFMFSLRKTVTESVRDLRVPAVYGYREYAEDGGLITYGANISDTYRRAADYVDKILKGAQWRELLYFAMALDLRFLPGGLGAFKDFGVMSDPPSDCGGAALEGYPPRWHC